MAPRQEGWDLSAGRLFHIGRQYTRKGAVLPLA